MKSMLSAVGACLIAQLAACSGSSNPSMTLDAGNHRDAGTEAGSVDASPGADAAAHDSGTSACFVPFEELPDCPMWSGLNTAVLLRAADVGEGAQFQTLGGLAVAASRMEDGAEVPVVIHLRHDGDGMVDAQVLGLSWNPGDDGAVELRDVWGTGGTGNAFDANVFALACHAQAGCVVLAADSRTDDALRPLLQDSVAIAPQGLIVWRDSLCVYGAGIHCHDGTRWTRWADDDERLLRDMGVYGDRAVAVGDRGRVLVKDGRGFLAATTGATSDLHIAYMYSGTIAAGSDREIVRRSAEGDWSQCALDIGGLVALAPTPIADTAGRLVHRILDRDTETWTHCAQGELAAEEPLLSSSFAPCGAAQNPMLLSASALWGSQGRLVCVTGVMR